MDKPDPYADDPFFKRGKDWNWNACVGPQGSEENYLNGYIESALELAMLVIQNNMWGHRDTLILPILYNARHGLELGLKFAIDRFVIAGVVKRDWLRRNHNIKAHWGFLNASAIGDEKFGKTIKHLQPFVDSLSRIDTDGQELRYHTNRQNDPSLANYPLVNFLIVRSGLVMLKELIRDLQIRTVELIEERDTKTYTNICSRTDLLTIASLLPSRDRWKTEEFVECKNKIRERFRLSTKQFSSALDVIQKNREMRAAIGMESDFVHLTNETIIFVVNLWRNLHPARATTKTALDDCLVDDMFDDSTIARASMVGEVIDAILSKLSPEGVAELSALYYLGRDGIFVEYYEAMIQRTYNNFTVLGGTTGVICQLMEKNNLLDSIQLAVAKVGRLSLQERLKGM